jgi:hypothetical protein
MLHTFQMRSQYHTHNGFTANEAGIIVLNDEEEKDKSALPFFIKDSKIPVNGIVYVTEALNEGKKVLTDNKVLKSKVISGATGTSKDE